MEKTTLYLIILALSMFIGLLIMDNVYAERNISYSSNFQQSMYYTPEYHGASNYHSETYDFDNGYYKNYDYYFDQTTYDYNNHNVKILDYNRGEVEIILTYDDQLIMLVDDVFINGEDFESKYFVCTYVNWC